MSTSILNSCFLLLALVCIVLLCCLEPKPYHAGKDMAVMIAKIQGKTVVLLTDYSLSHLRQQGTMYWVQSPLQFPTEAKMWLPCKNSSFRYVWTDRAVKGLFQ